MGAIPIAFSLRNLIYLCLSFVSIRGSVLFSGAEDSTKDTKKEFRQTRVV